MRHRRNGNPTVGVFEALTPDERFDAMLGGPNRITGCIPWMGARRNEGHGMFRAVAGESMIGAHRYALERALGRPLLPGMQALHHCDNPPCCNPGHLYEGTNGDNMRDRRERSWYNRVISPVEAERIREAVARDVPRATIADRLGVHVTTISAVVRRVGAYRD